MKIHILFEDNHIIAVEKPVNVPSQKDKSNDEDMLTILKRDIKERYDKPGNVYLGLVHRLDRPAGGVMIFAKTSKAASRLSRQMRDSMFKKKYYAIVHGQLDSRSGTLRHYLSKDNNNTVAIANDSRKDAKLAVLDYNVMEYIDNLSLVEVDLITGRPHQIRAQFAGIGHPLWGDQRYGSGINKPGQQLALWSTEIAFSHPISNERIFFTSMPPKKEPWSFFTSLRQSLS